MRAPSFFCSKQTILLTATLAAACIPPGEQGQCTSDEDCNGRGTVCELTSAQCVPIEKDYSSTAEPSPPLSFTDKAIPFFRGRICSAPMQEAQTGSAIPVTFQPCLHPCITPGTYQFYNQYFCNSGSCNAFSVVWVTGSSDNCPADAWGEFDPAMCNYDISANTALGPITINGNAIEAFLNYEIPYLSNLDIANIADYFAKSTDAKEATATDECISTCVGSNSYDSCLFGCYAKDYVDKYPQQSDRTRLFAIDNTKPTPPSNCTDDVSLCECYEVGFE